MEELPWAGSILSQTDATLADSETTCCPSGKHIICRQCISGLVKSKVSDGIVEIKCFDPACTARAMTPNEVFSCVTRQVLYFCLYLGLPVILSCSCHECCPHHCSGLLFCLTLVAACSEAKEVYSKAVDAAAFGAVTDGISCPQCGYLEFKPDQEALMTDFHCRKCYQVNQHLDDCS